jgi:hypothetical protein
MVTVAIEEIASMFRAFMKDAYFSGLREGEKAMLRSFHIPWEDQFNDWFDKNYGDIIGIGTEAPASEKMSEKEENENFASD